MISKAIYKLLPALLLATLLCTRGSAQNTTVDTMVIAEIPLTTVSAFGDAMDDPSPAATVDMGVEELRRYDQSSLLSALNRMPGVRFEERATGSYRIAIRGASLRSPFGVRNTQVYWNGLPYGEPGGDVPLNFLDASNIDGVEVLRGPSGGFYGPGTAGTMLLNTDIADNSAGADKQSTIGASLTAGSYGFVRGDVRLSNATDPNRQKELRIGYQRTDGYREHSAMDRFTAQTSFELRNGRAKTKLHALYTDLSYELPGGLNAEQYDENPRQARPGSVDKNASINYHNLLLGLTDERYYGKWKAETAIYASGFYFDHPFNFDYKRETNLAGGGRVAMRRLLTDDLDLTIGVESRLQMRFGNNFTNPDGTRPGDLNFSDEIFSREGLLFSQIRYQPNDWDISLGLSSSSLTYNVDRTFNADGATGETDFTSDRPVSLRLAVGKRLGRDIYVYASRADGFSPPSLDEFRTNEGSLNTDLNPEIGTNYEVGAAYTKLPFSVNATVFTFRLSEAITSFADARGTQLFRNSGQTTQNGFELLASYFLDVQGGKGTLHFEGAYTYYDFTYDKLSRGGEDFSGQTIPGAAPHTTNLSLTYTLDKKYELSLLHNFVDAIPLNDANDVFADAYHLVRAQASIKFGKVKVFVAGSNLLDEKMSFGNDLNPRFGGRYFQPAPGRNWQLGGRLLGL